MHRQDTAFTLYLSQHPPAGILAQLFKISQKWHEERGKPQHSSGLITQSGHLRPPDLLDGQRLSLLNSKAEAKKDAAKLGILIKAGKLTFQRWDRSQQQLCQIQNVPLSG